MSENTALLQGIDVDEYGDQLAFKNANIGGLQSPEWTPEQKRQFEEQEQARMKRRRKIRRARSIIMLAEKLLCTRDCNPPAAFLMAQQMFDEGTQFIREEGLLEPTE